STEGQGSLSSETVTRDTQDRVLFISGAATLWISISSPPFAPPLRTRVVPPRVTYRPAAPLMNSGAFQQSREDGSGDAATGAVAPGRGLCSRNVIIMITQHVPGSSALEDGNPIKIIKDSPC
ncbi:hypothetical protein U0070_016452, partial [Myodes glareolus]